jgi:phage terminase small subunit
MSKALAKRGLTPKQRLFALEWSKDCNATQAAIRAGYSAKGAQVQGHKLLSNAKVLELARGHLATRLNRAEPNANRILNNNKERLPPGAVAPKKWRMTISQEGKSHPPRQK